MTVEEFVKLHGGAQVSDGEGVLLLPDGASVRFGQSATSTLCEPPTDPHRLHRLKVRYWQSRFNAAKNAEQHFWAAAEGNTVEGFKWSDALGPPPDAWHRLARVGSSRNFGAENEVKAHLSRLVKACWAALESLREEGRRLSVLANY
jgi:hypothetical protein